MWKLRKTWVTRPSDVDRLGGGRSPLAGAHSRSPAQTRAGAAGAFRGGFLSLRSAPGAQRPACALPAGGAGLARRARPSLRQWVWTRVNEKGEASGGAHTPPGCLARGSDHPPRIRGELTGEAPLRFTPCCFTRREHMRRRHEVPSGAAATPIFLSHREGATEELGALPRLFPLEIEDPGVDGVASGRPPGGRGREPPTPEPAAPVGPGGCR
ncbi:PREDICTED: uncharacterized protein LOC103582331, partial [Galeopterus variegatus]|uniref:Uncharacterized protein LOC103582331 n=1 Tax=Galeopterus variegatus TaxID=482537 RepID=A0ABM0Q1E0_GALVR